MYKTNWTTEELSKLKDITNHKVIYDGYEFVWMSRIRSKWRRHCVDNFIDYNKPMSWIYHHIYRWNKEYRERHSKYVEEMKIQLDIDVKIKEISRVANIKTKQKILEILNLKPNMSNKNISDVLGVTIRTVERHRR
jgi:hypothetical protein